MRRGGENTPALGTALGLAFFSLAIVIMLLEALSNGTWATSLKGELPAVVSLAVEMHAGNKGQAVQSTELLSLHCLEGDEVSGSFLGSYVKGKITKVRRVQGSTEYLVYPSERETDPMGGQWGISVRVPSKSQNERMYMATMRNYMLDECRSVWLKIAGNGVEYCCADDVDVFGMGEMELEDFSHEMLNVENADPQANSTTLAATGEQVLMEVVR